jgi:hypothetical protein
MRREVSSDVFDCFQTHGLELGLLPLGARKKIGTLPLKTEDTEHSLVEVYDISILPIAPRIVELRVNEVVTHVDT